MHAAGWAHTHRHVLPLLRGCVPLTGYRMGNSMGNMQISLPLCYVWTTLAAAHFYVPRVASLHIDWSHMVTCIGVQAWPSLGFARLRPSGQGSKATDDPQQMLIFTFGAPGFPRDRTG